RLHRAALDAGDEHAGAQLAVRPDRDPLELVLVREASRIAEVPRGGLEGDEGDAGPVAVLWARTHELGSRMRAVPGPELRRPERLPHRDLHGVELVVAGHLLRDPAVVVLEDDEVPDEVQEAAVLEHTLDEDPELRLGLPGQFRPIDRAPRLEPLPPGPEDADAGLDAVRHD